MQIIILAGGLGTRMRTVRPDLPKALIPIAGKPFTFHQIEWAVRHGVTDVVYSIGYKGDAIRAAVGDGRAWGVRVRFVDDGETPVGTGGALRRAYDEGVLDERFAVQYGDSYLPFDMGAFMTAFETCGLPAMMTVHHNPGDPASNNVDFADGIVRLYDKRPGRAPTEWIDYGMSAFERDLIAARVPPRGFYDLADLTRELSLERRLAGYPVADRYHEIGSPEGLAECEQWLERSQR